MNYSTLKTVATVFNILGILQIAGTFLALFMVIPNMYNPEAQVMVIGGGILCAFLSVLWFALAQFINLLINAATQIENIDNNLYIIASKVEKGN